MADTANRLSVDRSRVPLFLDPDLVEWINHNTRAGGPYGSPSHAIERALDRLRSELEFVKRKCHEEGVPFRAKAHWALYGKEMEQSQPGRWNSRLSRVSRLKIYATVANELLDWATQACVKEDVFHNLSHVAETGLRRLRGGSVPLTPDSPEPRLTVEPARLWSLYRQQLGAS